MLLLQLNSPTLYICLLTIMH